MGDQFKVRKGLIVSGSSEFEETAIFNGDVTITDKIIHSGDTNTAIRFPENDTVTVETGGVERVRVTSAGDVGIGTTEPQAKLDVDGAVKVTEISGVLRSTSGGFIDLPEFTAGSFVILEIYGSANPNSQGSGAYLDPIHLYVYKGNGFSGAVLSFIYSRQVSPTARLVYTSGTSLSANVCDAVWFNGTTESDSCPVNSSGHYVRLKITGFNPNTSLFNIRAIKRF